MILNRTGFEFNNKEPIYLQIIELVKKNIASGEILPGEKLPSVREMSKELGVNPNTLQRAYTELERLGITYTKRGMGSFIGGEETGVNDLKNTMGLELCERFLNDIKAIGINKEDALEILKSIEE